MKGKASARNSSQGFEGVLFFFFGRFEGVLNIYILFFYFNTKYFSSV